MAGGLGPTYKPALYQEEEVITAHTDQSRGTCSVWYRYRGPASYTQPGPGWSLQRDHCDIYVAAKKNASNTFQGKKAEHLVIAVT